MSQNFQPGDYLIFQIESAFGLLRILDIEQKDNEKIWHLAVYEEMFLDIDSADKALTENRPLTVCISHAAITNRAFEATQTSRMKNTPLENEELKSFIEWKDYPNKEVSNRSIRLLLGMR